MNLKLYMDHHVDVAITEGLRRRGIDVVTAFEDGGEELPDDELLIRATELERLLVTQDRDFLTIAAAWQRSSRSFPGILFAPQTAITISGMIADLELICSIMLADELQNQVKWLPL